MELRTMIKTLSFALVIVLLVGCSSIPLSTMLRMSSFGQDDIVNIKPDDLRAKISMDKLVTFTDDQITLQFSYEETERKIEEAMALVLIEQKQEIVEHWFSEDEVKQVYLFAFNEESVEQLKKLQRSPILLNPNREGSGRLSVNWKLKEPNPRKYKLSLDLLLVKSDGFFTLIEDFLFDADNLPNPD